MRYKTLTIKSLILLVVDGQFIKIFCQFNLYYCSVFEPPRQYYIMLYDYLYNYLLVSHTCFVLSYTYHLSIFIITSKCIAMGEKN